MWSLFYWLGMLIGQFLHVQSKINCALVKCSSTITQKDCKAGEILIAGQSQNGCCPGCKGGLGVWKAG